MRGAPGGAARPDGAGRGAARGPSRRPQPAAGPGPFPREPGYENKEQRTTNKPGARNTQRATRNTQYATNITEVDYANRFHLVRPAPRPARRPGGSRRAAEPAGAAAAARRRRPAAPDLSRPESRVCADQRRAHQRAQAAELRPKDAVHQPA